MSALSPEQVMRVEGLAPRYKRVLQLRHGLIDGKVRTVEEVASRFEVTPERIRQIEKRALRLIGGSEPRR